MPTLPLWRHPAARLAGAARTLALVPPADADTDLSVPDHELLLSAVAQRLRRCASAEPPCSAAALARADGAETRLDPAGLCECAHALDRLRPALARERRQRESASRDLGGLRAALAAARLELAGTRASEQQARHLAAHDELTTLPRRSALQARLEGALAGAQAGAQTGAPEADPAAAPLLAVMYLDLDDFKPVNDRHGHAVGDELLRIVAQRLRRAMRAQDMVCRLGGDEFACLLTTPMSREHLGQVAAKLFDTVSAPLKVEALALTVRPSIGIAMCPRDGDSAQQLLERADAAMYRAKRRQLGYAFFDARVDA
jgi:diguanylate cyclase (GGDEF)-like protein